VHVTFVHRIGGSHSGIYDLPEIGAEETDWGMLRTVPNCTRVIVPPMAGLDGSAAGASSTSPSPRSTTRQTAGSSRTSSA
jgi:hypothetical protein